MLTIRAKTIPEGITGESLRTAQVFLKNRFPCNRAAFAHEDFPTLSNSALRFRFPIVRF